MVSHVLEGRKTQNWSKVEQYYLNGTLPQGFHISRDWSTVDSYFVTLNGKYLVEKATGLPKRCSPESAARAFAWGWHNNIKGYRDHYVIDPYGE